MKYCFVLYPRFWLIRNGFPRFPLARDGRRRQMRIAVGSQAGARVKGHDTARGDFFGLARPGISARARGLVPHSEFSKPGQQNRIARGESLSDAIKEAFDEGFGLLCVEADGVA
jgi:hypothetical protein